MPAGDREQARVGQQHDRADDVVPDPEQPVQERDQQRGPGQRHHHPHQVGQVTGPLHPGRLVQFGRDRADDAASSMHRQRQPGLDVQQDVARAGCCTGAACRASANSGMTENGRNSPMNSSVYSAECPRTRRRAIGNAISRPSTVDSAAADHRVQHRVEQLAPRSAWDQAWLKLLRRGEPGVSGEIQEVRWATRTRSSPRTAPAAGTGSPRAAPMADPADQLRAPHRAASSSHGPAKHGSHPNSRRSRSRSSTISGSATISVIRNSTTLTAAP